MPPPICGRGEQREAVGAEAVEGDVAEVEQAGPADRDVEADGEQGEQQHVDADLELEVVEAELGHEQADHGHGDQPRPPADAPERPLRLRRAAPGRYSRRCWPSARPTRRPRAPARCGDAGRARSYLLEVTRPSRPDGRRIITAMRIPNTIRLV